MQITNIEIHNILSIEDIELSFDDNGLTLIEGWDYDENRSNGAGKSAIFNAISFGLYDKVPRKITKTEILRKGTKEGYCIVTIVSGKDTYIVKRSRPTAVEYRVNDEKVDMTQEEFESKIGLVYTQFITTMYTAQNTQSKFIYLNDREKKDFILNLMKLGEFNDFHKQAKIAMTELDKDLAVKKVELSGLQSEVNLYKESLVDPDILQSRIESNNADIKEHTNKIIELQKTSKPDFSEYQDLENKVSASRQQLAIDRDNRSRIMNDYNAACIEASTEFQFYTPTADTKCPDCDTPLVIKNNQAFHLENVEDQRREARAQYDNVIKDAQNNVKLLKQQLDEYDIKLAKKPQIEALAAKIRQQKEIDFRDYNTAQQNINEYQRVISIKESDNATLLHALQKNADIKQKINGVIQKAIVLDAQKKQLSNELDIVKSCSQIFSPTGAPAYIMDSVIEAFNEIVHNYIQMVWANASYKIQTYKVKSDKTVSTKFSEELIINGKNRSIGGLSGGELRLLSLALDFAILEVLSTQFNMKLNPIILDEPFDSLDAVGREAVIDLLNQLSTSYNIIVIDHATEVKTLFSQVIKVEKKAGISSIANNKV